ncbi:MerR family transcriptional regulator [Actinophytocola sediminis]
MRIGELAAAVGVSVRTVRHYHRRGLLAEPGRRPNGYRDYGLRDVIALARIRRLTELGLSLDEAADALADDSGRDLYEILVELDGDLARQEQALARRRSRLGGLIERARQGRLHADDAVSAELRAVLDAVTPSPMADRERELLALLEGNPDRDRIVAALPPADPALRRRLEELAEAEVDDRRVPALADDLAAAFPPALRAMVDGSIDAFGDAVLESLAPAQAEVMRLVLRRLAQP